MLDNINKKIKGIRQLPENVRMLWVWGCVIVSMFIISIFWIFSISSMFASEENSINIQPGNDSLQDIKDQIEVLQKQASELKSLDSSGTGSIQDIQNEQKNALSNNPVSSEGISESNQSKDYSQLPKNNSVENISE